MKELHGNSTHCVVARDAIDFARRAGLIDSACPDLEECKIIESVKQLMAMGLSTDEIEQLDIRQPMLQAVFDCADLGDNDDDASGRATRVIDATIRVVEDEKRKLDMELQMLKMRKRALDRRAKVLRKIADCLQSGESNLMAA